MTQRQRWGTRIGLILAMAGNAVGLGNFLRFPVQAAKHGGGAFMIPYFISFLLLGIPLMWVEWSIGRYGGVRGHGTSPGIFSLLWKNKFAKYIGIIGVAGPLAIVIYYAYIESWTLAYAIFSLFGKIPKVTNFQGAGFEEILKPFGGFLTGFIGTGKFFIKPSLFAYLFFVITILINIWVIARGVAKGIEAIAKIAMPLLFIFAVILVIRIFTLGSPVHPDSNALKGLAFLWEPDFSKLLDLNVWLSAAGQIFFTLSIGMGAIMVYASYLREEDDIALSGLATASTNEFAEVVLGASIAIPAAVIFFGYQNAEKIAQAGAFNLAFVSMPAVLSYIPLGNIFGFLWFGLLFFAGITSSLALTQPAMAFLEDEFKIPRKKAAILIGIFIFLSAHIPIFIAGALDELDFWMGTFFITLFAGTELIIFFWVFNPKKAWEEINKGADIKIPKFFYYVIRYVTPLIILAIFLGWFIQSGWKNVISGSPGKWIARAYIIMLLSLLAGLVYIAFRRRKE